MKRKICLFAAASLMLSCNNDFIHLDPVSSVNIDVLYQTDKDFYDAFPPVYDVLQSIYNDFWMFGDLRADDAWQEVIKNDSRSYMDLFTTNSSDALIQTQWQLHYRGIYRANVILERIADKDIPNKNRYIAEASFLRALLYFNVVRIWGDVPIVTKPLTVEEAYNQRREPVSKVYELILSDLQTAEAGLPNSYGGSDVGKPTAGAAKALLGRVMLTIGDFQRAESKLAEVTQMGYALLPDYNDLWKYDNEHHSEYIFDIEYEEGMDEGTSLANRFMPNSLEFLRFYNMVSTEGGECNSPTQELINLFEDHDTRKLVTVGTRGGFYDANGTFRALPGNTSQTYTMKYMVEFKNQNDAKCNWKVIRYGDVLLMYAEALNENNKTDQAIGYLNQIRARAGVSPYPLGMSQADTREAIIKERRLELSFEGVRWFDLVRWNRAYETMSSYGMREFMTVFPLPLSQVDLINDPTIFPQNPGYN